MKLIICGGREYKFTDYDVKLLNSIHQRIGISEVVSGGCSGADKEGEGWAMFYSIPIKQFIPDWVAEGKKAGPLRNQEMADYADACICFPGGKGTDDMRRRAVKAHLLVMVVEKQEEASE